MSIKKVKGGYAVVHCHGRRKGKTIRKFKTRAAAKRFHKKIS